MGGVISFIGGDSDSEGSSVCASERVTGEQVRDDGAPLSFKVVHSAVR